MDQEEVFILLEGEAIFETLKGETTRCEGGGRDPLRPRRLSVGKERGRQ